jgi:nucleotide-binding universal stress UspA family protein
MSAPGALLVPYDFTLDSAAALAIARVLAAGRGSSLHIVHVIGPCVEPGPAGRSVSPASRTSAQMRKAAECALEEILDRVDLPRAPVLAHVIESDDAIAAIADLAEKLGVDLVVMGKTCARLGLSHGFPGRVVERKLWGVPCSVLWVRAGAEFST